MMSPENKWRGTLGAGIVCGAIFGVRGKLHMRNGTTLQRQTD